jgi:hypothetical protein
MRAWLFASGIAFASVTLASITTAGCHSSNAPDTSDTAVTAADAARLLATTPWLDHMPADEGDAIHLLQFDRRARGVYVNGSAHRGGYDTFAYEAHGDQLRVTFLHDGAKVTTRFRIERIKRAGFDLRLTFNDSPRGPSTYYGFANARQLPAAVRAALPAGAVTDER